MDEKTIAEILLLKSVNDHGAAYLMAAQALGLSDLADRFERINRKQLALGHLPPDLCHDRHVALEEMLAFARSHMITQSYQRFYMLF